MSCLFESLGRFVNLHPSQLRAEICNYLISDPVLVGELKTSQIVEHQPDICTTTYENQDEQSKLKKYVSEMSKPIVMGGAVEIIAFCNMYKKNVVVRQINHPDMKHIEFIGENSTHTIAISWNGGHYEPDM